MNILRTVGSAIRLKRLPAKPGLTRSSPSCDGTELRPNGLAAQFLWEDHMQILTRVASAVSAAASVALASALFVSSASAMDHGNEIVNCADENWCAYHRTVDKAWRYSPLDEINKDTVGDLGVAWLFQPGGADVGAGGLQSTPLVLDGAMYVAYNPSSVMKLDAETGARLWAYVPEMNEAVVARSFFSHTRGLAVGGGRVYMGLADGRIVALNQEDGSVMWDEAIVDSAVITAGFSGAATYIRDDLMIIGQNGGEYPVEGRIFGINPQDGSVVWTFYTTGRDDEAALATWGGDSWLYGGGGSWQPGTVDFENNQILIGTGNPNPDYDYCGADCRDPNSDAHRPGDNLYTSSTVALDLDTGKLNWYFQEAPSDPYDYDASPGEYVIFEADGRRMVLHPGKSGFNHVHDAASGQPLAVYSAMNHQNWTSGFNLETGEFENMLWPVAGEKTLVCPAIDGGHSWNAGAFDPGTGAHIRVVQEWCMWLTIAHKDGSGPISAGEATRITEPYAQAYMAAEWIQADPEADKAHGRLVARMPLSGEILWERRYDIIPHSALMTTAGGLVFNAAYDGNLEAIDSASGDVLWTFNLGSGTNGGIISYGVGGKQYVAVATGHGSYVGLGMLAGAFAGETADYRRSALLVAFTLN